MQRSLVLSYWAFQPASAQVKGIATGLVFSIAVLLKSQSHTHTCFFRCDGYVLVEEVCLGFFVERPASIRSAWSARRSHESHMILHHIAHISHMTLHQIAHMRNT